MISPEAMDNQNRGLRGSENAQFFDLLQPSSSPNNKTKKKIEEINFDIVPSYDFQPIHPKVAEDIPHVTTPKSMLSSKAYSFAEHTEPAKPRQENNRESYDVVTVEAVERIMKQYTDNLLHALEGISRRLSHLESTTRHLETSLGELKMTVENNHGATDGRLRLLENHTKEVQAGVQILRDKQEIAEAHSQLMKLQLSKSNSSISQAKPMDTQQNVLPTNPPASFVPSPPEQMFSVSSSLPPQQTIPSIQTSVTAGSQYPNSSTQIVPNELSFQPPVQQSAPAPHPYQSSSNFQQVPPPSVPSLPYSQQSQPLHSSGQPVPPSVPSLPYSQQSQPLHSSGQPVPPSVPSLPLPYSQQSQPLHSSGQPVPPSVPSIPYSQQSQPLHSSGQPVPPSVPSIPYSQQSQPLHSSGQPVPPSVPPPYGQSERSPHMSVHSVPPPHGTPLPSNRYGQEPSYMPTNYGGPNPYQQPPQAPLPPQSSQHFPGGQQMYEPPLVRTASGRSLTPMSYGPSPTGLNNNDLQSHSRPIYRVPQPVPSAPSGGAGYSQLPTAQPVQHSLPVASSITGSSSNSSAHGSQVGVDEVIDNVSKMGYSRAQVASTVQRLMEKGQQIDVNVVLDKLDDGAIQPQKDWFTR